MLQPVTLRHVDVQHYALQMRGASHAFLGLVGEGNVLRLLLSIEVWANIRINPSHLTSLESTFTQIALDEAFGDACNPRVRILFQVRAEVLQKLHQLQNPQRAAVSNQSMYSLGVDQLHSLLSPVSCIRLVTSWTVISRM